MIQVLRKVEKKDLIEHLSNLNLNDPQLYKQINTSTFEIFQFTGDLASKMVQRVKPETFEDLVVINSCARPGTSAFLDDYILNKDGQHPKYPKIVNDLFLKSRGVIVWQEQLMSIFNKIGGFNLEETNYIRGLMKKLGKANKKQADVDEWGIQVERFIKGAVQKGVSEFDAKLIAEDLLRMSSYSFNRAHAYAYVYLAVETLYLANYYKQYFYCAGLSYESTKKDALKKAIDDSSSAGYKVLPPDINTSDINFMPTSKKEIIFGLQQINGISEIAAKEVISKRPYKSVIDFIIKHFGSHIINKRVTSALVCGGAFDTIIHKERKLYENIVAQFYANKKTKVVELLESFFNEIEKNLRSSDEFITTHQDFINYDKDYLDYSFHSIFPPHIKEEAKQKCLAYNFERLRTIAAKNGMVPVYVNKFREHMQKNDKLMCFVDVEDMNGARTSIPIFASNYEHIRESFKGVGFYYMLLFINEDNEIMFGTRKFATNENKKRMLRSIS